MFAHVLTKAWFPLITSQCDNYFCDLCKLSHPSAQLFSLKLFAVPALKSLASLYTHLWIPCVYCMISAHGILLAVPHYSASVHNVLQPMLTVPSKNRWDKKKKNADRNLFCTFQGERSSVGWWASFSRWAQGQQSAPVRWRLDYLFLCYCAHIQHYILIISNWPVNPSSATSRHWPLPTRIQTQWW